MSPDCPADVRVYRVSYLLKGLTWLTAEWLQRVAFPAVVKNEEHVGALILAKSDMSLQARAAYTQAKTETRAALEAAARTVTLREVGAFHELAYDFTYAGSLDRNKEGRLLWLRATHEDLVLRPIRTGLLEASGSLFAQQPGVSTDESEALRALSDALEVALRGAYELRCTTFQIHGDSATQ